MPDLAINADILNDQARKVDGAAEDLESVSLTAPDLDRSTAKVSAAVNRLTQAATNAASRLRTTASSMRTSASSFTETDEDVAQGAQAISPGAERHGRHH